MTDRAVVAMSGGQDSTTCLAWAIDKWGVDNVHAVTFDYKQRHRVELDAARKITKLLGVTRHTFLDVPAFSQLGAAALTSAKIPVAADATDSGNSHAERHDLPSTFVPGRNLIFLGLVGAYAAQHGITNMVTGVCEADAAGYPDCRASFVVSFELALNEAMGTTDTADEVNVYAPLLNLDKGETWRMAADLGVLEVVRDMTHTCYEGTRDTLHAWGYGCAECPACHERRNGYEQAFLTSNA